MKLIPLTQGKFAKVDDEDFENLIQWRWYVNYGKKMWYAKRTINHDKNKKSVIIMHRFILGLTDPKIQVDHVDHDGLNNQRSNLRPCTQAENKRNKTPFGTSKYLGVFWKKKRGKKWTATICSNGKRIFLGYFVNELDAALCYDVAAKKYHGEFANLNFKA